MENTSITRRNGDISWGQKTRQHFDTNGEPSRSSISSIHTERTGKNPGSPLAGDGGSELERLLPTRDPESEQPDVEDRFWNGQYFQNFLLRLYLSQRPLK